MGNGPSCCAHRNRTVCKQTSISKYTILLICMQWTVHPPGTHKNIRIFPRIMCVCSLLSLQSFQTKFFKHLNFLHDYNFYANYYFFFFCKTLKFFRQLNCYIRAAIYVWHNVYKFQVNDCLLIEQYLFFAIQRYSDCLWKKYKAWLKDHWRNSRTSCYVFFYDERGIHQWYS